MLCILTRKILEHHSRMHEHTHMHIALRIMQWFCNTHQTHLRVYEEFTSFLANCRHPDECFGLLALISAVQPKSPTRLPNSLPFTNTHWTIQPLDITGLPIPYLHMTHTSRAILYLHWGEPERAPHLREVRHRCLYVYIYIYIYTVQVAIYTTNLNK